MFADGELLDHFVDAHSRFQIFKNELDGRAGHPAAPKLRSPCRECFPRQGTETNREQPCAHA